MTALLIQKGSNHIYVSTPELLKRSDMSPYEAKKGASEPIAEAPEEPPKAVAPQAGPDFGEVVDDDGMSHVRAEMEAITEAEELIAHAFKKYNIKLNPAMKKSTMILRVTDTLKERESAA